MSAEVVTDPTPVSDASKADVNEEPTITKATGEAPQDSAADSLKAVETATVDPKVKKQIEFYFSDSNLPKDKFLLSKVRDKSNPEGWIDLALIVTFKRMREFGATEESLAAAAKSSEFLVVSEDGKKVRRTTDLPDSDITLARSIMAKGFPENVTNFSEQIDNIEKFFSQYGTVKSVRLNKYFPNKDTKSGADKGKGKGKGAEKPKGTKPEVTKAAEPSESKDTSEKVEESKADDEPKVDAPVTEVTKADEKPDDGPKVDTPVKEGTTTDEKPAEDQSKSEEQAAVKSLDGSAFIEFSSKEEAENVCKQEIVYNDVKLTMMMKADYLNKKFEKKGDKPDKNGPKPENRKRGREEGGDGGEHKKARGEGKEGREHKEGKDKSKEGEYVAYSKGVFVKLAGVGADTTAGLLRDIFSKYGKVKFVEYKQGETDACVRFDTADEAKQAVDGEKEAKTEICGAVPEVALLTGEEEDAKIEAIKQYQLSRNAGRDGGRGGRAGPAPASAVTAWGRP